MEYNAGDNVIVEYAADLPVDEYGSGFPRDKKKEKQHLAPKLSEAD